MFDSFYEEGDNLDSTEQVIAIAFEALHYNPTGKRSDLDDTVICEVEEVADDKFSDGIISAVEIIKPILPPEKAMQILNRWNKQKVTIGIIPGNPEKRIPSILYRLHLVDRSALDNLE